MPPCCLRCRSVLDDSLPDVHIYTDHTRGKDSGSSPGFAILLTAETSSGCVLAAERAGATGQLPEVRCASKRLPSFRNEVKACSFRLLQDTAKSAARRVLKQVTRRGCVDARAQVPAPVLSIPARGAVCHARSGFCPRPAGAVPPAHGTHARGHFQSSVRAQAH